MGEIISAVEVLDHQSMELVQQFTDLSSPIGDYPFYLMIETSGSNSEHDEDKLNNYLKSCMDKHFVLNGVVANSTAQREVIFNSLYKVFNFMNTQLFGGY